MSFMENNLEKIRRIRPLGEAGGGTGFLFVFMFFFFSLGVFLTFMAVVKSQHKVAVDHRDQSVALQLADSGLDQILSQVRDHTIKLPTSYDPLNPPTNLPMTITVPVGASGYSTTAYARVDFERSAGVPVQDIEGNLKYNLKVVVGDAPAAGHAQIGMRRGVKAVFSLVNFGRYAFFGTADDSKAGLDYTGPYHANGNLTITSTSSFNNKKLYSSGTTNNFYADSYVTAVTGKFVVSSGVSVYSESNNYSGSGLGTAYDSTSGSYNILTTTSCPLGTWLDGTHGAVTVTVPPVNISQLSAVAQVVIDANDISNTSTYLLQGTGITGAGIMTLPVGSSPNYSCGVASPLPNYGPAPVRINLSALNKGYSTVVSAGHITDCQMGDGYLGSSDAVAAQNYHAALASTYGLVIFVRGDAAIWGELPMDTQPSPVTHKKVTIVATGNVQAIGDILYSQSPWVSCGAACSPETSLSSNPLTNNPNQDGIAVLIGGANFFVNPWSRDSGSYYVEGGQASGCNANVVMEGLFYVPNGVTGGQSGTPVSNGQQVYASGGETQMDTQAHYGAVVAKATLAKAPCGSPGSLRVYDANLQYNLSSIIPNGTTVSSWQEDVNPPFMRPTPSVTPTPTP